MKIGLYFGSFNPVHIGHLIVAQYVLNFTTLDKIWFVLSPQNPLKKSNTLLNEYDRLNLLKLAIENKNNLWASNIEFNLPKPSYTAHTLAYLQEKYSDKKFSIIMGSDSFRNLPNWKNYEFILTHYPIYIYQRKNFELNKIELTQPHIHLLETPLVDISSSMIRQYVREKKQIDYLVPDNVKTEIEKFKYYTKQKI